jgi:exodeoxyribonuclease V alpha subunit
VDEVFEAFCAAGLWPGLGRTTGSRLADAGIASPDDVTAARLELVDGVGPKRAERLAKSWVEARPAYDVAALLHSAGLAVRVAGAAVDRLGPAAAARLAEDPWRLLEVESLTPREADVFALRTLAERPAKTDVRRGRAFALHVLARAARDGHTVLPQETVVAALAGLDVPEPAGAVEAALQDGRLLSFETHDAAGEPLVLLGLERFAMAEDAIAEGLARLAATAPPLTTPEGATSVTGGLDAAQRAAVQAVAAHGVSLLTGGPGTGKSRTVAAVVALARARGKRVALAAPTGRAAKRLEELTAEPATTIHRLLGAQGTTGEFARGEDWPLDADVVVVDETSMLDVELAAALVDACADGTHLLMVGDPAQLPSIGPGRVLGDLVDSEALPITELTTLHRQAEGGAIARLATAVRGGALPPVDSPDREVVVVPARSSQEAAKRVVQLVTDSIPRALGIPADDVQVVTPVHRGPAGTIALNTALKAVLNPGDGTVGGFDVGDRVVATANHLDDGFANGEVGVVTEAKDGTLTVAFAAGPATVRPAALGDLKHGWAITVHRAQGSEWPAVVAVLPPEATGMLSRPLVYTALTRAQRHLSIVHAGGPAVARAVRDVGARPRRTRLRDLVVGDA